MQAFNELNTVAKVNVSLVQPRAMALNTPDSRWYAMWGIVTEDDNCTLIGNCLTAKQAQLEFETHFRGQVVHVYCFFKAL